MFTAKRYVLLSDPGLGLANERQPGLACRILKINDRDRRQHQSSTGESAMVNCVEGKTVLVTGGTGSIGSEIVKQILKFKPKVVRILEHHEDSLFTFSQGLEGEPKLRFLLGDVRDADRVKRGMEGVEIVFHAAALKHVPLCEYNPFEAISTNVMGTQNVIDAALYHNVKKVILISSDKAVNPINTMGATKLLAEKLFTNASHYRGVRSTVFSCVRFGNVINSNGSVIKTFQEQIARGGPVTITHKEMTRFLIPTHDAVNLVLNTLNLAEGGEVFILKRMVSVNIYDLARVLIHDLAPQYGIQAERIPIKFVGTRAGERLHETLMTYEESQAVIEHEDMLILLPQTEIPGDQPIQTKWRNAKGVDPGEYSSKNAPLNEEEIRRYLNLHAKFLYS